MEFETSIDSNFIINKLKNIYKRSPTYAQTVDLYILLKNKNKIDETHLEFFEKTFGVLKINPEIKIQEHEFYKNDTFISINIDYNRFALYKIKQSEVFNNMWFFSTCFEFASDDYIEKFIKRNKRQEKLITSFELDSKKLYPFNTDVKIYNSIEEFKLDVL